MGGDKRSPMYKKPPAKKAKRVGEVASPEVTPQAADASIMAAEPPVMVPAVTAAPQPVYQTTAVPMPVYSRAPAPMMYEAPQPLYVEAVPVPTALAAPTYSVPVVETATYAKEAAPIAYAAPAATTALTAATAASLFDQFDRNHGGVITRAEYEQTLQGVAAPASFVAQPTVAAGSYMVGGAVMSIGTCPQCGNTYMSDSNFCRKCGNKRFPALP